jgi:hypothetical protein
MRTKNNKKSLSLNLALCAGVLLVGCGKKENETPRLIASQVMSADNKLLENIDNPLTNHEDYAVKIARVATNGHRFLLGVAQFSTIPVSAGEAIANKVVFFERRGPMLYLFEDLTGKMTSTSLPTRNLLAQFKIIGENNDYITFDFNEGMKNIFVKEFFISDRATPAQLEANGLDAVVDIQKSFLEKVELQGKTLYINQYVRVNQPNTSFGVDNVTLQLKYTLQSYVPDTAFVGQESNRQKRVGFFEVHPNITAGSGESSVKIMKFDLSDNKTITWSLSRNVPAEYRQAVTDGVLYWNQVFGREVVKVQDLAEGVGPHEPGFNVVQWLDWDKAGMAYANMSADPYSGKNLQSNIYMTSVFGKGGVKKAKEFLKKLISQKHIEKTHDETSHKSLLKNFHAEKNCELNAEDSLADDAANLLELTKNLTDEESEKIFKRYAEDYVRQVTAHEIGHTLGLRHNFAGSVASNITPKLYDTVSRVYFLTGELMSGFIPASTVMDYTPTMTSSMSGAHIRLNRGALAYDKQAIDWGYNGAKLDTVTATFCTDTDRDQTIDCKVWDRYSNIIEGAHYEWRALVNAAAFNLALKFNFLEKSDAENISKINKLVLDPKADVEKILIEAQNYITALTPASEYISIRKKYGTINLMNEAEYKEETNKKKLSELKAFGNLTGTLTSDLKIVDKNLQLTSDLSTRFAKALTNLYPNASAEELTLTTNKANKYIALFGEQYLFQLTAKLNSLKLVGADLDFQKDLLQTSSALLTLDSKQTLGEAPAVVDTAKRLFSVDTRKQIAQTAVTLFMERPNHLDKKAIASVKKSILTAHQDFLKTILKEGSEDDLAPVYYDFVQEEKEVYKPFAN